MADVTLGFDELETNDLPPVCLVCGARRDVAFVPRRFMWRPLFAPPGLLMMLATKRVTAEVPLCPEHGGPRLFATQRFTWGGLKTVAIGADRLTLGRVSEEFVDALYRWRDQRRRGAIAAPPPVPRQRVQVGRGTGGGGTALKVIGILVAVMVGLLALMAVGMFGLMALGMLFLPKAAPPAAPPPARVAGPSANVEARPEDIVVALLAAAPQAEGPAVPPWAPLALAGQKATFHLLEDAELDKAVADLKSPDPNAVEAAAKRLAAATPDPARRKQTAEALAAATTNPFPTAREAVAAGLAVWAAADDAPALARMLADPFPSVREATATAVAGVRDTKLAAALLPDLEKAAHDPVPNAAKAAAEALKAIRGRQNLEEKRP